MRKSKVTAGSDGTAAISSDAVVVRQRTWKDSSFGTVVVQFARNKAAVAGLIIIFLLALMAIFAPLLAPYNYTMIDPLNANQGPSLEHWFGTDAYGRDILSRIIYGARASLGIGIGSSALGVVIGIIFGAIAGYFGGIVETIILRLCDILQSIPNILLCILVSSLLGSGLFPTMVALAFYSIPEVVRLMRSSLISLREQEFVEACKAVNCSKFRILVSHLLPNSMSAVIVSFSIGVGMKIMNSAGLSFLGLGIQEPMAEWGAMISLGRASMETAPHAILIPGIFVALVVLAFNIFGDGLRDALDPKQKR